MFFMGKIDKLLLWKSNINKPFFVEEIQLPSKHTNSCSAGD